MTIVVLVVLGLVMGSFLSVLISRWPHWEGVAAGRSRCPSCMHELAWFDLVPLVSWVMLRGRCRYCSAPVSTLYPTLELSMAVLFALYGWVIGVSSAWTMLGVPIVACLVALFFFDAVYQMLPDVIVGTLGAVTLVRLVWLRPDQLVNAVAMAILLMSLFGLLYVMTQGRGLGFGDVKLAGVLGLLFGFPVAIGMTLCAIWLGAFWGVGLLATGRAHLKSAIPFGAIWVMAALAAILLPGQIAFLSGLLIPIAL